MEIHGIGESTKEWTQFRDSVCKLQTQEELRKLSTESLWLPPDTKWDEIDKHMKDDTSQTFPDTICEFDIQSWENECHAIPEWLMTSCIPNIEQ